MHQEVLNPNNKEIFFLLKNFPNFYLVGGTALALQIDHRVSDDFDLFSGKKIPKTLLKTVEDIFAGKKIQALVNNTQELTVLVNGVQITFLYYPFPIILDLVDFDGIQLLSIKEIAVTKAYTIGRRGSYKDYVDLYFVLAEEHVSLEQIIELAEKKYMEDFSSRLFLEQLVYLEDITDTQLKFLKKKVSKDQLEGFFNKQISKLQL